MSRYTKASDPILLPSGTVCTLGEALDRGDATLHESTYYIPSRYFARLKDQSKSWEVRKTLFDSRTTGSVSIARKGR